eukprot:7088978-Prymnesium_polylepis.1
MIIVAVWREIGQSEQGNLCIQWAFRAGGEILNRLGAAHHGCGRAEPPGLAFERSHTILGLREGVHTPSGGVNTGS